MSLPAPGTERSTSLTAASRQRLEHLRSALELEQGFGLYVIVVNGRGALVDALAWLDLAPRWLSPDAAGEGAAADLLDRLDRALGEPLPLLLDASRATPSEHPLWGHVFRRLNESRNEVAARFRAPLLLALPPSLEAGFAHEAPDFWSIRSLVVRLEDEPERLPTHRPPAVGDVDVFIIAPSTERASARALHEALAEQGLSPFFDMLDLQPGDAWDRELPRVLQAARASAILIGDAHQSSYFLRDEIALSLAQARADPGSKLVLPVYLPGIRGPTDIPYPFAALNGLWWEACGGPRGVAAAIRRRFETVPPTRSEPVLPPVAPDRLSRSKRYEVVIRLSLAQFGTLLFQIGAPKAEIPPATAPQSTRAIALVTWLDTQPDDLRSRFDELLVRLAPGRFL